MKGGYLSDWHRNMSELGHPGLFLQRGYSEERSYEINQGVADFENIEEEEIMGEDDKQKQLKDDVENAIRYFEQERRVMKEEGFWLLPKNPTIPCLGCKKDMDCNEYLFNDGLCVSCHE